MIDHISIAVSDLARSAAFYEAVLEPLGLTRLVDRPHTVGFGKRYPEFWLNARPGLVAAGADTGMHVCLRARTTAAVAAFHAAALAGGGADAGAPGMRDASMGSYFAAFIHDLDGNKIEAASFLPAETT
ncbi:VOC family protein [bacterium SCSIO 12827]|nr:VOC family protein [bacterium SCSIO 12827]